MFKIRYTQDGDSTSPGSILSVLVRTDQCKANQRTKPPALGWGFFCCYNASMARKNKVKKQIEEEKEDTLGLSEYSHEELAAWEKKKKAKGEDVATEPTAPIVHKFRYVICIQDNKDKNRYHNDREGNSLKEMKDLAEKIANKDKREVMVWDNFGWLQGDGQHIIHMAKPI